jgi:hypothetical protein
MEQYYLIRYKKSYGETCPTSDHEILAEVTTYNIEDAIISFISSKRVLIDMIDYMCCCYDEDDYLFDMDYQGSVNFENVKFVTKLVKFIQNKYLKNTDSLNQFLLDIRNSHDRENTNNFDIIESQDRVLNIVTFNKENIKQVIDTNIIKKYFLELNQEFIPDLIDLIFSYI